MAKVNVTKAAELAGIGRQHFYRKYLTPRDKAGKPLPPKISVEEDHAGNKVIDTAEIIRVFGKLHEEACDTGDIVAKDKSTREETHKRDAVSTALATEVAVLHQQLATSQAQLAEAREQTRLLQEDKTWLKVKVDELTDTLKQIEHKPAPEKPQRWWNKKLW